MEFKIFGVWFYYSHLFIEGVSTFGLIRLSIIKVLHCHSCKL